MNNIIRRRTKPSYKRCAFTGYRPAKMPFGYNENDPRCIELKKRLNDMIRDMIGKGYAHFLSGGAQSTDCLAAEAVLDLKEDFPWILLEMVIPFDGQADRWDKSYQARHARLLHEADIVTVMSHEYTKSCMF
ncbi:MAG: SLOG family protein, partial [Clostridia bacterium]|nr:SLOG family protein [Clostridia bacterium]